MRIIRLLLCLPLLIGASTAAQERAPQERAPQERAPQERAPQERAPQERAPQERAPQERAPQERAPQERAQWTTSRVHGTPDPPLPFVLQRVFDDVPLEHPTEMVPLPGTDRWIVVQLGGSIVSFTRDSGRDLRILLEANQLASSEFRAYGITFHPNFPAQPWCYIAYTAKGNARDGTRLSRFRVDDPAIGSIDPDSETVLAAWNSEGHSGGSLHFGRDGYLYVSVGDGQNPNPPDKLETGQDLSDLEASILRIDVDHPSDGLPYGIPDDNPFVDRPNTRGEIWAFGLRNPWKMAFHPSNGSLWAGDVGWEMREMVYRIDRGANYGWSVTEGSQIVKSDGLPTEIPITPAIVEHTHLEARSVTGGYFWQSNRLPELDDAYIYGDWMTGKIWGLRHDGKKVTWHKELADTTLQIICFALDHDGEVLVVGYDGTVHRLVPNPAQDSEANFPRRLSETGLFTSTANQIPAPGVVAYEVNAHHWADQTDSQQWVAVPGGARIELFKKDNWQVGQVAGHFSFPHDTVLAKTISYHRNRDDPGSAVRLETQLLHKNGDDWNAYNYVWNEDQTDAALQPNVGSDRELSIIDSQATDGIRQQTWHHASRDECLMCHIWSAGTVHGFKLDQLNRSVDDHNQLDSLEKMGILESRPAANVEPMCSPDDTTKTLEQRARSYLHLNCAHCHRRGGGGTAAFDLVGDVPLEQLRLIDALPTQGGFGISQPRVVAAGDPYKSVLLYRLIKSGRGHMPQFGSSLIDDQGVDLIHDWIASLGNMATDPLTVQSFNVLRSNGAGEQQISAAVDSLLATTSGAMALSIACGDGTIRGPRREWIADTAARHPAAEVRDLFERFLPESRRLKRLGTSMNTEALLSMKGDAEQGRELYFTSSGVTCRACHRIGQQGNAVGPDLSGIALQRTPNEILDSILRPSAIIDAKYRGRMILTVDGTVLTGLVTEETDDSLIIVDAAGKPQTISRDDIDVSKPLEKSVMPDLLLAEFTAQQAADLLAFLNVQTQATPDHHRNYKIVRASGPLVIDGKRDENVWDSAESVGQFHFTWWNEGDGPKQTTDAKMLWDDRFLYVSFVCADTDVNASRTQRDGEVYRDDCVEIFASPEIDHPTHYFNLEINALGTPLDNYRPDGNKTQQPWNPEDIAIGVHIDGTLNDSDDVDQGWSVEVAIPFELFHTPVPGEKWRLNLHRLEDDRKIKSQWSPGDRNHSSFHTPDFFGFVEFVK